MKFYQTYVKYCLLVHERKEAFLQAKVLYNYELGHSKVSLVPDPLPMSGFHNWGLSYDINQGMNVHEENECCVVLNKSSLYSKIF